MTLTATRYRTIEHQHLQTRTNTRHSLKVKKKTHNKKKSASEHTMLTKLRSNIRQCWSNMREMLSLHSLFLASSVFKTIFFSPERHEVMTHLWLACWPSLVDKRVSHRRASILYFASKLSSTNSAQTVKLDSAEQIWIKIILLHSLCLTSNVVRNVSCYLGIGHICLLPMPISMPG